MRKLARGYLLIFIKFLIILVLYTSLSSVQASVRSEYEIKAAFLYNFTRFVSWTNPPEKELPLRVCVLGDNPFGDLLAPLAGRKSQGRELEVRIIENIPNADSCHVLFISMSESRNLPIIITLANEQQMLTISDIPNFIRKGGIIGYIKQGNVIRFEINLQAANTAGLHINSRLLELALRVIR